MVNYNKSKIYRIYPNVEDFDEGDVYYGSTTKTLAQRMSNHRTDFKNNSKKSATSSRIFEKYGMDNCKMELIQEYPCDNIEQLKAIEGSYIRNNKCVNRCLPLRTHNESRKIWRAKRKLLGLPPI